MKVLFANKFFYLKGGSERVFFQEREYLVEEGVEIVDFSMRDPKNLPSTSSSFFVSNIDYHSVSGLLAKARQAVNFVHSFEAVDKITRLIRQERPEIAHLHNIYHQLTPAIIPVLREYGVKVILTVHDSKLICPGYLMLSHGAVCTACRGKDFWKPVSNRCQGSRMHELLLSIEAYWHVVRKSYDAVDIIISPSSFLAELMAWRFPREKVVVLRNGIDMKNFTPCFSDRGYCLYFGRVTPEKGVETLLKAHRSMEKPIPLKIAGTGPLEERLRSENRDVEFLGHLQGADLIECIKGAGFVIMPSECLENAPMSILEAMAMGKPVIASRAGGVPEFVEHGETGLLFDMGNWEDLAGHMTMLANRPNLRSDLGRAARTCVENRYSHTSHGRGLMGIYERVLSC